MSAFSTDRLKPLVSVVIIGRNEGPRLTRCLNAVAAIKGPGGPIETIYVDSASTDDSVQRARWAGAQVIEVRPERPSAALGRNAGWQAAQGEFILFLDGDTELHPDFLATALRAMADPQVSIVWGHRRESRPQDSIYNRVLDLDWIYPPGPSDFCGGDALVRRSVLAQVRGFDATLIAGEEPELCRRIRTLGRTILHLDIPMTRHDLAITRFGAYWRRAYRAGHAYAEVSARFRATPDPLWQREARRNRLHGILLITLLALLPAGFAVPSLALASGVLLTGLIGRTFVRCGWKSTSWTTRLLYSVHANLQQIPILAGQLGYLRSQRSGRRQALIEYKTQGSGA